MSSWHGVRVTWLGSWLPIDNRSLNASFVLDSVRLGSSLTSCRTRAHRIPKVGNPSVLFRAAHRRYPLPTGNVRWPTVTARLRCCRPLKSPRGPLGSTAWRSYALVGRNAAPACCLQKTLQQVWVPTWETQTGIHDLRASLRGPNGSAGIRRCGPGRGFSGSSPRARSSRTARGGRQRGRTPAARSWTPGSPPAARQRASRACRFQAPARGNRSR
jgi:hypothetical protein